MATSAVQENTQKCSNGNKRQDETTRPTHGFAFRGLNRKKVPGTEAGNLG